MKGIIKNTNSQPTELLEKLDIEKPIFTYHCSNINDIVKGVKE